MKSDYRLTKKTHTKDGVSSETYYISKAYYHTDGEYHKHDPKHLIEAKSVDDLKQLLAEMALALDKPVVSSMTVADLSDASEKITREHKKNRKRSLDLFKLSMSYKDRKYAYVHEHLEKYAKKIKKDPIDFQLEILSDALREIHFQELKEERDEPLTCVAVMADYCSKGLWRKNGSYLGSPFEPNQVGNEKFVVDFNKWIYEYNRNGTFDWDYKAFNREGVRLAQAIKTNHPNLKVIYHPVGRNDRYFEPFVIRGE